MGVRRGLVLQNRAELRTDPWFSALDTVDYYTRLGAKNGGADAVNQWARLFLVPGMGHCQGGSLTTDSYDSLTALFNTSSCRFDPKTLVCGATESTTRVVFLEILKRLV